MSIDRNGIAAGRSLVNQHFGTANITATGGLRWSGALGSTRMAGSPTLMEREVAYWKALAMVSEWRAKGETLTLSSEDDAIVLRFSR